MTYFTIKWSFYGVLLSYGVTFGSGVGIAYAVPLGCGMKVTNTIIGSTCVSFPLEVEFEFTT